MSVFIREFHRVKNIGRAAEKTAELRPVYEAACALLWEQMKEAAYRRNPGDISRALAEEALELWASDALTGVKLAAPHGAREVHAASFAAAYIVDIALANLAKEGALSDTEVSKLALLNAESALADLTHLTKEAWGPPNLLALARSYPELAGAALGGLGGAGVGAWKDEDHRLRGALAGGSGGAILGALAGHGLTQHQDQLAAKARRLADEVGHVGPEHVPHLKEVDEAVAHALSKHPYPGAPHNSLRDQVSLADAGHARIHSAPSLREQTVGGTVSYEPIRDGLDDMTFHAPPSPLVEMRRKKASITDTVWRKLSAFDATGGPPAMTRAPDPVAQAGSVPQAPQAPDAQGQGANPDVHPGDPSAVEPLGQSPEEAAMQAQQQEAEAQAKQVQQHMATVDNLAFLAQQVGLPSMAQEIDATRDQLMQHFAAGNTYLPHNLQKYFPQSEHAKQFIEKYKARFAPLTGGAGGGGGKGGGAKKTAFEDKSRVCAMCSGQGVTQPSEGCDECKCSHGPRMNEDCEHCKRYPNGVKEAGVLNTLRLLVTKHVPPEQGLAPHEVAKVREILRTVEDPPKQP